MILNTYSKKEKNVIVAYSLVNQRKKKHYKKHYYGSLHPLVEFKKKAHWV